MARVLLTVSGVIEPSVAQQVADGLRPEPDYYAMAQAFDAHLIDYAEARRTTGWFGRVLERVGGPALNLAWACFQRRRLYDVMVTDGEQVGIPLALLLKLRRWRHTRHAMIVHILSVRKKMIFFDLLRIQSHIHTLLVYSTWQKQFIERRWKIASERVVFTPFMVDARFFNSRHVIPNRRRMICSAGLEFRDYATLIEAVSGLDVEVVIAAASPWSKRADRTANVELPANVTVRRFSQYDLRQLYADSSFVVMPLEDVDFQAGVTAILEAMAMERAVVCSRTRGQTDILVEGQTGLYVPPGDASALRAAILRLLDEPQAAERLGQAARTDVEARLSLQRYVERLTPLVCDAPVPA